jgi:hypothetical protein
MATANLRRPLSTRREYARLGSRPSAMSWVREQAAWADLRVQGWWVRSVRGEDGNLAWPAHGATTVDEEPDEVFP